MKFIMSALGHLAIVVFGLAVCTVRAYGEAELLAIIMGPGDPWHREVRVLTDSRVAENALINGLAQPELLSNELSPPEPPSPDEAAKMARFIVHYSLWGSLSHISLQPKISGSPLARVYSLSDGPLDASSGVPFFYLTPNDPELVDMFKDPRASLTLTLAQTPYCRAKAYDPEDPRCAQVILTGKLVLLKNSTAEWNQAKKALFTRHPVMKNWPNTHHWMFCKLDIKRILVADNFGGNKYPSVEDYYKATPSICSTDNPMLEMAFY